MAALDAVSHQVPVDRWQADGLGAWPLFRYELSTANHYLLNPPTGASSGEGAPAWGLTKALRRRWKTWVLTREDRTHQDTVWGQRDAVFYSDGVSFARLGNSFFEKFCDPLIDRLRADFGVTTLLVTPMHRNLVPRHSNSVLVQDQIDAALVASKVSARLARVDVELPGFEDALRIVERMLPNCVLPTRQRLFRNAHISNRLSVLCEAWLRLTRPRVVFIVAYYGNERAAMVLACRKLGVPCVDIQHGAVSDIHFAYARIGPVPSTGYELLPDWFWVWTADDQARIEAWAKGTCHRALVGGNPFTRYCIESTDTRLSAGRRTLDAALAKGQNFKQVLFSAHGYETRTQLEALGDVIRSSRDKYRWWIRMHPSRLGALDRFHDALSGVEEARVLLAPATELPLPLILPRMDVHVTECSSTADEAAQFGVPTVLFAEEGIVQFAPLIERKLAVPVDGFAGIERGIVSALSLGSRVTPQGGDVEREALRAILEK